MTYSKYTTPTRLLSLPSSSSVLGMGWFVLEDAIGLTDIVVYLGKFGTAGGSETLTLKVYGNDDLTAAIASSAAVTVSTLSNMATNWLGWARFTFSTQPALAASRRYYLGITSANYTVNGTTFFIGVQMDKHAPFNKPAHGKPANICRFRINGVRQWPE